MSESNEARFYGVFTGHVTDVADPKALRRVRVVIPGVCEPQSAWAKPMGAAKNHTPRVGDEVAVQFEQGVLEYPRFDLGGYTQAAGLPQENAAGDPNVTVMDTENFRVVVDERPGTRGFRLFSRKCEDMGVSGSGDMLKFDYETNTVTLQGTTRLVLQALGEVKIDGGSVTINGRMVMPTDDPI